MQSNIATLSFSEVVKSGIKDFSQLVKFRLTMMVVFSTGIGFLMADYQTFSYFSFFILLVSGFFITGAANGINQIIERDLDKLMTRTQNRPIAQGRLRLDVAVMIVILLSFSGIFLLGKFINPLSALISGISLLVYGFVYTPLKQKSSISVWAGAVAGAAPPLIGYTAASGQIDTTTWLLFAFQFVWQLPHFWALAWVLNDEYNKAGFYLLPTKEGRNKRSALITFLAAFLLIPLVFISYYTAVTNLFWSIALMLLTLHFVHQAYQLYQTCELSKARRLMFGSFYYLPVMQLIFILDKFIH